MPGCRSSCSPAPAGPRCILPGKPARIFWEGRGRLPVAAPNGRKPRRIGIQTEKRSASPAPYGVLSRFQRRDDRIALDGVAYLDHELQLSALHRRRGEEALVADLDDIAAGGR